MMKKAVIVAAGLSSRLYPLTLDFPKGLLKINNEEILKRSVNILKNNGITDIAIVIGYKKEMIMNVLGSEITYILNPFYKHCNNMGSLFFAKDFVKNEKFIYLHGDIVYDENILKNSLKHFLSNNNDIELVTDFKETDEEAMKVKVDNNNYLIKSNKEIPIEEANGEWIGIAYFNNPSNLFKYIEETMFNDGLNYYDTYAFTKMSENSFKIYCSGTNNLHWIEIDFKEDYEKAKELF